MTTITELAQGILSGKITINDVPEGRRGLVSNRIWKMQRRVPTVEYAGEWIDIFATARAEDGSCKFCGQQQITRRHNCDELRYRAETVRDERAAAQIQRKKTCAHKWRCLSHEEFECVHCGAIKFVPDE